VARLEGSADFLGCRHDEPSSKGDGVNPVHTWEFIRNYIREPRVVGAIAPSSRALARAIFEPYRQSSTSKKTLLEIGAGTGAITRHLGPLLGNEDELDICEIQDDFCEILERDILTLDEFRPAMARGAVRILRQPAQQIAHHRRYDFVLCGLPFTSFEVKDVKDVFSAMRRCLKPGGVFTYYEYVGLRKASEFFSFRRGRNRVRDVSVYLKDLTRKHQFHRKTVLQNLPPAWARHLRFD